MKMWTCNIECGDGHRNSIKPGSNARGRPPKKQTKSIAYENATHFHLPLNMTFL
ncbi:hypothetical protein BP1258A_2617 [Burkholderia pseudomallei 1258a]|uniref:Uncharacterized protein n=3 Tax=Burkholderia pseudomallei TaxID=28450 RepID=A0A0H3HUV9_BURP2|nr:hypothetical protein BP1026B_I3514 [Burkholderia pseudomallei 1026b]EIF62249.1 hypothetical protein BP1258A_2617 [Burkholderia pseudomallei 1258a]EIF63300.1 hypothetical protein BP1258B_2984 [Burkholderia pseudomallei 1258b]EIF64762.1 hypothetical protein BP1026A_1589 [Burkholderia pseudomallei 1026a]EIF75171.1 hypothetical protein BP354E_2539 [Burkholderia pseudomallei 354e]EIF79656.1 hypothetical protein BP354A_3120 [Burkholderia pseudomallei 354a]